MLFWPSQGCQRENAKQPSAGGGRSYGPGTYAVYEAPFLWFVRAVCWDWGCVPLFRLSMWDARAAGEHNWTTFLGNVARGKATIRAREE